MRRVCALLAAAAAVAGTAASSAAADPAPPGADMSANLSYQTRLADTASTVDGNFDRVGGRDLLLVTGRYGIRAYDLRDPDRPRLLSSYMPAEILGARGLWENEDVDVDRRRKLLIVSVDPRHDNVNQDPAKGCPGVGTSSTKNRNPNCRSGFYVVSYANPSKLRQVGGFTDLPAGHTSTCIEGCRYVWTGGPARRDDLAFLGPFEPGGRGDGRPVWVTDLSNPARPKPFPKPIDLGRNDGATDYSHDVQVDRSGIAWTSGRGGIRGYATRGWHRDPYTKHVRRARAENPVLVAGGGISETVDPAMFLHNSLRPLERRVDGRGVRSSDILIGTEEQFNDRCDNDGRVTFSDLRDSWGGRGAAESTPEKPYRLRSLSTWHPIKDGAEGVTDTTDCSAHYFDLSGSVLATTWYGQGTRLLDISDVRKPRQIAYYRVTGTGTDNPSSTTFSARWQHGRLYVFDMARGVEVLRLKRGVHSAARMATVRAPAAGRDPYRLVPVGSSAPGALVCPLYELPRS